MACAGANQPELRPAIERAQSKAAQDERGVDLPEAIKSASETQDTVRTPLPC